MVAVELAAMPPKEAESFLRTRILQPIYLTQDYRNWTAGAEFSLVAVTDIDGTIFVSGKPNSPGPGIFHTYTMFTTDPPPQVPPAESKETGSQRFGLAGAAEDSPLFDIFQAFAPPGPEAERFYLAYQSEYGEEDTGPLDELMFATDVALGDSWTVEQVTAMTEALYSISVEAALSPDRLEVATLPSVSLAVSDIPDGCAVVSPSLSQERRQEMQRFAPVAPEPRRRGRHPKNCTCERCEIRHGATNPTLTAIQPTEQDTVALVAPNTPADVRHIDNAHAHETTDAVNACRAWDWTWKGTAELVAAMLPVYLAYPTEFDLMVARAVKATKRVLAE